MLASERTSFLIGAGSAAWCASAGASQSVPGASARVGHRRADTRCGCSVSEKCVNPCAIGGSASPTSTRAPKRCRHRRRDVVVERAFGQAPQAAPDADVGALLEQDLATALDQQHADRALRQCLPGPRLEAARRRGHRGAPRSPSPRGTRRSAGSRACRASRRGPSTPACRHRRRARAMRPSRRPTARLRPSARPAIRRFPGAARARASRCRRGSLRRRRTPAPRWPPRSSGRRRAASRAWRRRAGTRRRDPRPPPSRPRTGDARAGSSRARSTTRARNRSARAASEAASGNAARNRS